MRVLSDWRLRGLLGLTLVAGGLGWMYLPTNSSSQGSSPQWSLRQWVSSVLPQSFLPAPAPTTHSVMAGYGALPLHFEPNVGQASKDVKFLAHSAGYSLLLTPNEAVLHLSQAQNETQGESKTNSTVLRARLEGANLRATIAGQEKQKSYSNYFIGNDPRQWHSGVAHYSRVHYEAVWPGIDLVYYGNQRQLEYDFIVQPGANPGLIRMSWHGADNLYVDNDGNLIAETRLGPVRQHKPVVYQTIAGKRQSVAGRYALAGNQVSFTLGDYDKKQPLVIDPVLVYSTYLGGGSLEHFNLSDIAVTPNGSAYVAGYTDDTSYPISTGAYQPSRIASHNTVVSRLNYNGRSLVYSTYIGGNQPGEASSIAVDASGNAYIAGSTKATDFPLTPTPGLPYQSNNLNSKGTGFITKLAADGKSIIYSTYLGGSGSISGDHITALAIDASGQAYVTGDTDSSNFPVTAGSYLGSKPAGSSASGFVSRLSANGQSLDFSTFFGGSSADQPRALALAAGDIFLGGSTSSTDLPGTPVGNVAGGGSDAFVARLSGDGQSLRYARYVGGSNDEQGLGVAADSSGNVWLAGSSKSLNFPLLNELSPEGSKVEGVETAFLTQLDTNGAPLRSTWLGLSGKATGVALTSTGQAVVVGQMTSAFTPVNPLTEVTTTNASNGFIWQLNNSGAVVFSTPLGGTSDEEIVSSIALDSADAIYVTGTTRSNNFPVVNPLYTSSAFTKSGFISKLTTGPKITLTQSTSTTGLNTNVTLGWQTTGATSCRWDGEASDVASAASGNRIVTHSSVGSYDYTLRCQGSNGVSSETLTVKVVAAPTVSLSITSSSPVANKVAVGQTTTLTWSSTDTNSCSLTLTIPDPDGGDDDVSSSNAESSGNLVFAPVSAGTMTYEFICAGSGSSTVVSTSVVLEIVNKPALTLKATPTVSPLLKDVAGQNTVTYEWTATNVDANQCTASGVLTGTQPVSSTQLVTMTTAGTNTLTLTCVGPTGTDVSKSVSVTVLDPTLPPSIDNFSASPSSMPLYQNATLSWSVSNALTCTAQSDAGAALPSGTGSWTGSKTLSGTAIVTPLTVSLHSYTLSCDGPGGNSQQVITVDATMPPPAAVTSLIASPSSLSLGQSTTVNWQASNAESCVASGDWSGSKNPVSSALIQPTHEGSTTLTLTCTGAGGSDSTTGSRTITVMVNPPASTGDNNSNSGGDSGGPVDLGLLLGLGALGVWRRQVAKR